ncbi:hypothetical protein SRB5_16420 [Streptomyces sp. RB5]|uniref:Uncharacterized protein n=1 Tax=Streptomyces smaragdinus TaxID=2585196 RepID=A0A7K0CDU6_9ACTN|nr:hypothetical protein [Streptomyces smaragdinus]MQY11523.1 hypothetical protein [Streptomyces smaragdinus]
MDRPAPSLPDPRRAAEIRTAAGAAAALLTGLLMFDALFATPGTPTAVIWTALGLLLYTLVRPPRVSVSGTVLTVRGLLRERSVRLDLLVSVRSRSRRGSRLVLEDLHGGRVRLAPRVLAGTPLLWHSLDAGVRRARTEGFLRNGTRELQFLADHIDGERARKVFEASGMH